MSKPTRKPLGESLAENFVYGKNESASPSSPASKDLPLQEKEETLMSRLLEAPEQKEATIRFTVDLPESTHRKLSILAAKTGRKKAEIVRALLDNLLKDSND
jgi:hypothetical protein